MYLILLSMGCVCYGADSLELIAVADAMTNMTPTSNRTVASSASFDLASSSQLSHRGDPSIHSGENLKYIGMPVGGLTAGQLYLAGDGQLWGWDIFNDLYRTIAEHYASPLLPGSSPPQGFSIRWATPDGHATTRPLTSAGFPEVRFHGQYPIGAVTYADASCPVLTTLEAFSPFIPLEIEDSSLPLTILHFTVQNTSDHPVDLELTGWMRNAAARLTASHANPVLTNQILDDSSVRILFATAEPPIALDPDAMRPTLPIPLIQSVEKENAAGGAVGDIPATRDLTSQFVIERDFINLLFDHADPSDAGSIELHVDNNRGGVRWSTRDDAAQTCWQTWDVRGFTGQKSVVRLVGPTRTPVRAIQCLEQSDLPRRPLARFEDYPHVGNMSLALLDSQPHDRAWASVTVDPLTGTVSAAPEAPALASEPLHAPIGALSRQLTLPPGQSAQATFAIAWHFPNITLPLVKIQTTRHYATRFDSSAATIRYLTKNFTHLAETTRRWRDTWYDSTLPWWLLDRTFANTSTLATSTVYRLKNGRFYGWEGVGFCAGTCTHVWSYEQAMGRLFPQFDRLLRERVDFAPGVGFVPETGMIRFRGELAGPAVDGQAGTILRAYRDHLTSPDNSFLKTHWDAIKKATQWLISLDDDRDGIIRGAQHNTLDASWYGPIAWISGYYQAALRAAQAMAAETGDAAFEKTCRDIADLGQANLVTQLFNGEYFINHPDPAYPQSINSGSGCHIDQVLGQAWAHQVNLPRITPSAQTRSALQALWNHNFTPDVGPYRAHNPHGRWFAMPGEPGMILCTFPRDDWNYTKAAGQGPSWATGYFNECMSGFEHQVAAHMIWEGMVDQGLALERAIHDRYHPSKRNPYNEIEAGDHYARAMASYGVFLALCGFAYHGPKGHIAFAPRLSPENFRAAFTAAQGWGSFSQSFADHTFQARLDLRDGTLRLTRITLTPPTHLRAKTIALKLRDQTLAATLSLDGQSVHIHLQTPLNMTQGQTLDIQLHCV